MTDTDTAERSAMRTAIALSALGCGTTSPNPPVGCVLIDPDGTPLSQGYHQRKGTPHAEAHAVTAATAPLRGATAVVTLEPCNHHGRTPPCHQTLIDAGIRRVVIALADPTSRGEGGIARMRAAGLDVAVGVLEDEARLVLGPWLTAQEHRRPTLTWVYNINRTSRIPATWWPGADVLIDNDRHVHETHPGGHETLPLPTEALPANPRNAMGLLYTAGARSAILHAEPELAQIYLDARMIDEILAHLDHHEPSSPATTVLPDGYQIQNVIRTATGVHLRATPTTQG